LGVRTNRDTADSSGSADEFGGTAVQNGLNRITRMAFLELQNVCKGFGHNGTRTEVLRGIDIEIDRGEFVAIVGYSGAGKTTLIR
jgi:ABC-type bacteriocin/lantibiotic exporter with double-glycine peptidase domain